MNQWPGVRLRVTEGWDEEDHHASDSLHYEGRAVDVTTSDRDRSKYGMLARLAVEAGFDWVYYESRAHIHCSVKSESSDAAKYGGCFAGENTVRTSEGVLKQLSELKIGEKVLALDYATNELIYSEVIMFLDWSPNEKNDFLEIHVESGRTLTVTGSHLVVTGTLNSSETVFADSLKIGSNLIVYKNGSKFEDTVIKVTKVHRTGVYAPLTTVGTVIVNDIVVSCYAVVNSHTLAHYVFVPARFTIACKNYLRRVWQTIMYDSSPTLNSSSTIEIPKNGVHWYADILYRVANNFIPWQILHK